MGRIVQFKKNGKFKKEDKGEDEKKKKEENSEAVPKKGPEPNRMGSA